MIITSFWDIAPCILVAVFRRFRGTYLIIRTVALMMEAVFLKRQAASTRLQGAISQNDIIFTVVK
jgi:hypothetical protein